MNVKPGWSGRVYEDFEVGDVYRHRVIDGDTLSAPSEVLEKASRTRGPR